MIRIERPELPPELQKRGAFHTEEILDAIGHDPDRLKRLFQKGLPWRHKIRNPLEKAFHGKCAYCETRYGVSSSPDIDQLRPKAGVKEEDGEFPLHYAWLAFTWENQYPACARCNRAKKSSFPIAGKRAAIGAFGDALAREKALLLDPCADEPLEHLHFLDNGQVVPEEEQEGIASAAASIEILGLDRPRLVDARRERAAHVLAIVNEIRGFTKASPRSRLASLIEQLREVVDDRAEYAGMARQLVDEYLGSTLKKAKLTNVRGFLESDLSPNQMATQFARAFGALQSYSLAGDEEATEEDLSAYRARVRLIESIQIKNVKALRDVRIQVKSREPAPLTAPGGEPDAGSRRAPWMMILGENATGKSTLLKLIALTLIDRDYQEHLQGEPAKYVRQGCKSGFVKVKLSGIAQAHQLTFTETAVSDSGKARGQTLLLAYGTARLLTGGRTKRFKAQYARVENLFNPQIPLIDVDRWLRKLHRSDPTKFESARKALGRILLFEGNEELFWDETVKPPELKVRLKDAVVGLDQLSDGYHAVLALVADILSVLLLGWQTPQSAEGIVLIDELGTHLHPLWRMHVVERLREVLPKVQFVATTHDPLCLRGLENDEVVVLTRSAKGHVYSIDDLPPVQAMRVDQLLTSEHFGLSSTRDPKSEQFFQSYYALLAKTDRTPTEEAELSRMRLELPEHGLAGATRRERLMLEAIDYYLAAEPHIQGEARKRASQKALSKVLDRILEDSGE